jgi:hypothetical protein
MPEFAAVAGVDSERQKSAQLQIPRDFPVIAYGYQRRYPLVTIVVETGTVVELPFPRQKDARIEFLKFA